MNEQYDKITGEIIDPPAEHGTGMLANLAGALANVMAEIEPITKQGFNEHFRYRFTRMEDLLAEVTPRMAKHGLVIMQSEVGREIVDNMLYATFSFTLLHKSGEVWLERPRMTGMARIKDNKGGVDDKAMNKCHTAARKYFLLALFQIPTGDVEDGDDTHQEQRSPPQQSADRRPSISERAIAGRGPIVPPVTFPAGTTPRRIEAVSGETASTWADKYYRAVLSATSIEALSEWQAANADLLERLQERSQLLYSRTVDAETAKQKAFAAQPVIDRAAATQAARRPPSAKLNAEDFRAELDAEWAVINDAAQLDASWRARVEPIQQELFPPDLADLSQLWQRHATRIERER